MSSNEYYLILIYDDGKQNILHYFPRQPPLWRCEKILENNGFSSHSVEMIPVSQQNVKNNEKTYRLVKWTLLENDSHAIAAEFWCSRAYLLNLDPRMEG